MPDHRNRRVLLIGAATLAAACAVAPSPTPTAAPTTTREEDERAVWLTAIQLDTIRSFKVIRDSTAAVGVLPERGWLDHVREPFPYEAIQDIGARPRLRLSERLGELPGVHWLTPEEHQEIFAGEYVRSRDRFRTRFPGADHIISVSRVGFDAERRHAAVGRGFWCGPLCGAFGYVLLRRERDGRWVVVGQFTNTVS